MYSPSSPDSPKSYLKKYFFKYLPFERKNLTRKLVSPTPDPYFELTRILSQNPVGAMRIL